MWIPFFAARLLKLVIYWLFPLSYLLVSPQPNHSDSCPITTLKLLFSKLAITLKMPNLVHFLLYHLPGPFSSIQCIWSYCIFKHFFLLSSEILPGFPPTSLDAPSYLLCGSFIYLFISLKKLLSTYYVSSNLQELWPQQCNKTKFLFL